MPKFLAELESAAFDNLSSAPSSPRQGQVYYNTTEDRLYVYDGALWKPASRIPDPRAINSGGTSNYTIPGIEPVNSATSAVSTNQIRYTPLIIHSPTTINLMSIEVTSAVSGNARLGIYNADLELQPTSLVLDAGTVDVGTTGVKSISISQVLQPGIYLGAFNTNAAVTLRIVRGGARYVGMSDNLGSSIFAQSMRVPETFGAFSDPGTEWTSVGTTTNAAELMIFYKVSSI